MRIILIGPPGVGKGTQSEMLTKQFGCVPLSSGDIFRREIAAQTDLGELANRYISQGRLVPNGVTIQMMAKRMRVPEVLQKGFILDGFPRTVEQAIALDQMLCEINQPLDGVVSIEVDDNVVVNRLSGRLGCTKCGAIYHSKNKPPKREWICDDCNSPLLVREDDKEETIRERLKVFHDTTEPVVAHYSHTSLLKRIDGNRPAAEVYQDILRSLGQ